MTVFIDTSALFALLDADDGCHDRARSTWTRLIESRVRLATSNYVLVETQALVRSRLGIPALRALVEDIVPTLDVLWLTAEQHELASTSQLAAGRRRLSLVDCASFVLMRRHGIEQVFSYDRHFTEQGFERV